MKRLLILFSFFALLISKGDAMQKDKIVCIETNKGTIEIKLFPDVAPKACENFLTHIEKHYYDGIIFHRVIKGFMIQGGDPTGTGAGGKSIWGKPFSDELRADIAFDKPGLLAMANAGPNSNGSQFFITTPQISSSSKSLLFWVSTHIDGFTD